MDYIKTTIGEDWGNQEIKNAEGRTSLNNSISFYKKY